MRKVQVFTLLLLFLDVAMSLQALGGEVAVVTPKEALELLKGRQVVLIDVRERDETTAGILEGALWIPTSAIEAGESTAIKKLESLPKEKELLIYCRSGGRAGRVGSRLAALGYRVRNLQGYSDAVSAGMKTSKPGNH